MIKVLIIDDSSFIRTQVRSLFEGEHDFMVIGEGKDGSEAVTLTKQFKPDIIILDVEMPNMDGLQAIEQIMDELPTPIVLHTSSTISRKRNLPFEGIQKGALDILEKPSIYPYENGMKKDVLNKLRVFAGIKVFKRPKPKPLAVAEPVEEIATNAYSDNGANIPKVLAIAASTGGPKALYDLFQLLPPFLPFPILLVQHISGTFLENFISWLQNITQVNIKAARDGEQIAANNCYLSPGAYHLTVKSPGIIQLQDSPSVNSCKPSADVLFESIVKVYGRNALGIVLTGIGEDGARGLLKMKEFGNHTVAQDKDSSVAFGMPGKAIELNAAGYVGSIRDIAAHIQKQFHLSA
ncbi:MAG: chemotaxis response regulator protein-glutamate methylesterase [Ectothiorhodospiraceae bacterium]|nr:chemotaxis response regulator protein-glutamate methylesterase [Ectothiorhodospiraceae bacterium]